MGAPVLLGAGIGALGSAVTGGSPIKGALLGGAGGGLASGVSSLVNGGSFLEGAMGTAAKNAATGSLMSNPATGTGINLASAPASQGIQLGTASTNPFITNPAGDFAGINTDIATNATNIPSTIDMGANGLGGVDLNQVANMSPDQLQMIKQNDPTLWEKIKPYVTPQNMMGAANIIAQSQQQKQPLPVAPSGGIQRGSFQSPTTQLLNVELVPRRSIKSSLLG